MGETHHAFHGLAEQLDRSKLLFSLSGSSIFRAVAEHGVDAYQEFSGYGDQCHFRWLARLDQAHPAGHQFGIAPACHEGGEVEVAAHGLASAPRCFAAPLKMGSALIQQSRGKPPIADHSAGTINCAHGEPRPTLSGG